MTLGRTEGSGWPTPSSADRTALTCVVGRTEGGPGVVRPQGAEVNCHRQACLDT